MRVVLELVAIELVNRGIQRLYCRMMLLGSCLRRNDKKKDKQEQRSHHMRSTMNHTLSILLQNEAGALVRVAGLFAARGYNIDTLTVAATHDPAVSRLTLSLQCDDIALTQILQQTRKLVDVLQVAHPATALAA
jgi:acetolactate synthase-1/3 small subunit